VTFLLILVVGTGVRSSSRGSGPCVLLEKWALPTFVVGGCWVLLAAGTGFAFACLVSSVFGRFLLRPAVVPSSVEGCEGDSDGCACKGEHATSDGIFAFLAAVAAAASAGRLSAGFFAPEPPSAAKGFGLCHRCLPATAARSEGLIE